MGLLPLNTFPVQAGVMASTPLIYLDTNLVSLFARHDVRSRPDQDQPLRYAYSEALLRDRKNAPKSEREFSFLVETDALYLSDYPDGSLYWIRSGLDPQSLSDQIDSLYEKFIGHLFNRLCGGGPEQSDRGFFVELFSSMEILPPAYIPSLDFSGLSDEIESRQRFQELFSSGPKVGDQGLKAFLSSLPDEDRLAFQDLFPETIPRCKNKIVLSTLCLNFIMNRPAKGLRSEKTTPSIREVIDALHVTYGLMCQIFLTTDQSTATKARLLRDYWGTGGEVGLVDIKKLP